MVWGDIFFKEKRWWAFPFVSLQRDLRTMQDLQNHRVSNSNSRLEKLYSGLEKLRQDIPREVDKFRKEQKISMENFEYHFNTTTRDLKDEISTLNNKVRFAAADRCRFVRTYFLQSVGQRSFLWSRSQGPCLCVI